MQKDKITVIVPVYCVEKYIDRCIKSILLQTYKNLQIILVDDGSPDNSGKICDLYADKDPRIIVIHKNNGGLSDARNEGLKLASGKWVAFVDSDDCIAPTFIECLYYAAQKSGCLISQCKYVRFDSTIPDNNILRKDNYKIVSREEVMHKIDYSEFTAVWNKLYKLELFNHIRFPKGKIHEDVATTYKLYYLIDKICIINESLYYYFINNESITKSKINNKKIDLIDAYFDQVNFFLKCSECKDLGIEATNRLVASFGTLLSYDEVRYEDYKEFYNSLLLKYKKIRPEIINLRMRIDLKILVLLFHRSLLPMKYWHLFIKTIKKKKEGFK